MRSQIVIPQLGNIAANQGNEAARALQFGRETPALGETLVKNHSLKGDACPRWRQVPAKDRHFDERSGHSCCTDFQDTSALDHFSSCHNLCCSV
jgi:hypothetical protein